MAPQILRTGFLLFCIYLVFTPFWEVEYELVSLIIYLFILPVIMITPVVIVGLTIGLPLRFGKLHQQWLKRQWIAVAGMLAGLALFATTVTKVYFPNVLMLPVGHPTGIALQLLPTLGWFLLAFSSLHFYPKSLFRSKKS